MPHTVIATYPSAELAQNAVDTLRAEGVPAEEIGVLLADSGESRRLLEEGPGSAREGAALGSVTGATLFGLAAVALASTPVGILAVGPIAALIGGGVAGGATGGLLGAIVGLGIPEREAALRVEEIQKGGVLVTARVDDDATRDRLADLLSTGAARDVFTFPA